MKTAQNYSSKAEFKHLDPAKYIYAQRRHILNEICSHMIGQRVNYRENLCRSVFEKSFNKPFPTARPEWLINPLTGYGLELDGYCEELNLAFEYNGRVHYDKNHPNYLETKTIDKIKRQICKKHGVTLITINSIKIDSIISAAQNKINKFKNKS